MHDDLRALDTVCTYYRTTYAVDALRRARNEIRRLKRAVAATTVELCVVRCLLTGWKRAYERLVLLAGIL